MSLLHTREGRFKYDQVMSAHHRAWQCLDEYATEKSASDAWWALGLALGIPVEALDQIMQTAKAGRESGMKMRDAFPLVADLAASLGEEVLQPDGV